MQYESQKPLTVEERMLERQAKLITEHNEQFRILHRHLAEQEQKIATLTPKADMYDKIIKMVMNHEQLQSIWDEFVVTMKMLDIKEIK